MKRLLFNSLILFFLINNGINVQAQTTLALGSIAFTGYSSDPSPDEFSFVILHPGGISNGTTITFTDYGWLSGTCGTNGWNSSAEQEITWTASGSISYGTVVVIRGTTATIGGVVNGSITGTALSLSSAGDQIFAIQGARTGSYTMIAGIHMNQEAGGGGTSGTNWDNLGSLTAAQSNRPPCLTNGTYALFINPEVDNAWITGYTLTGTQSTDLATINNAANWQTDDAAGFPLPVLLTSIKAYTKNNGIQIEWNVGTENNLEKYIIEKSSDAKTFTSIGHIDAIGLSKYIYFDAQPYSGNNFFRILAVDIDGSFKYSSIIRISFTKEDKGVSVYSNILAKGQFNLQINNMPAGNYDLQIISLAGYVVFKKTVIHNGSTSTQTIIFPESLGKGIYWMRLSNKEESHTVTLLNY